MYAVFIESQWINGQIDIYTTHWQYYTLLFHFIHFKMRCFIKIAILSGAILKVC